MWTNGGCWLTFNSIEHIESLFPLLSNGVWSVNLKLISPFSFDADIEQRECDCYTLCSKVSRVENFVVMSHRLAGFRMFGWFLHSLKTTHIQDIYKC